MDITDRVDASPERAWIGSLAAAIVVLVGGAVAFTEQVYYGFIWRYFWGPVVADAEGTAYAAYCLDSGDVVLAPETCAEAADTLANAYVAEPGYTAVSTISYMVVLLYMLVGVYFLLSRFDLTPVRRFLASLVPFMLFGGALRAVEDSFVAANHAGTAPPIDFPASAAFISPFIYFTVFLIALGAFLLAMWLERADIIADFQQPLAVLGGVAFLGSFGYLAVLAATTDYVSTYPMMLVVTVGLATALSVSIYYGIERYRPEYNAGTGYVGLIVIWAHAIDGVANVLAADWTHVFGIPGDGYSAKHVVNRLIIDVTNAVQPVEVTAAIGDSWPFLVVKLAVATGIVALFDERFMEENRYYTAMLLMAIIAVGLGPGTRDMIRVTFGI